RVSLFSTHGRKGRRQKPTADRRTGSVTEHPPFGEHSIDSPERVTPARRHPYGFSVPARTAASSPASIAPASGAAVSPPALSAQEALPRLRSAQEAAASALEAHEAEAQPASLQEAEAQLADDHEAAAQDAALQEAQAQEASDFALLAQLAESKTRPPVLGSVIRKALRARFGFGGLCISTERCALISPTP